MTFSDKSKNQIRSIIENKGYFALYRRPSENEPTLIMENGGDFFHQFYLLEDLAGMSGFVVIPFDYDRGREIILINNEYFAYGYDKINELLESINIHELKSKHQGGDKENTIHYDRSHYEKAFNSFYDSLERMEFEKLVLSRREMFEIPEDCDLLDSFDRACQRYPDAMVCLWFTPQTSCWLCASPEIMLSQRKNVFSTVSLAGTMPNDSVDDWSDKNKYEQELVSMYIRNILISKEIIFEETPIQEVKAGDIKHLKTEFKFNLSDKYDILSLIKDLYPTPAISGYPKNAKEFILKNEGYSRGYYSSIFGPIDVYDNSDLYVNLRTAMIEENKCYTYAGGGILLSSDIDSEWTETEIKMKTIKSVILG